MREFKTIDTGAKYRCKVETSYVTGVNAGATYIPSVYFNYPDGTVPPLGGNPKGYIQVNTLKKILPLSLIVSAFDQTAFPGTLVTFNNTYYGWFMNQNNINRFDALKILGKIIPYLELNENSFFWNQIDFNETDFSDVSNSVGVYFNSNIYLSMLFMKDPKVFTGIDHYTYAQTFLYLELID